MAHVKFYFLIAAFTVQSFFSLAQSFTFECFHERSFSPTVYYFNPQKNIYQEYNSANPVKFAKKTDSNSLLVLKPLVVSFAQIGSDDFLIIPNGSLSGFFDKESWSLKIYDSAGANLQLRKFSNDITSMLVDYNIGASYLKFKQIFDKIKKYTDSSIVSLNEQDKGNSNVATNALKNYLMMRLAHYSVLPVLFKNQYDKTELAKCIDERIKITDPRLWLETQSGRIFLRTYYSKLVLPATHFDLQGSTSKKLFVSPLIKKYVSFYYFDESIVNTEAPYSSADLLKKYMAFKAAGKFTAAEYQSLDGELLQRIKDRRTDIREDFSSQELEISSGKKMAKVTKQQLLAQQNIIIDYWASWCVPCREKMNYLTTDRVTIAGKDYKIIFISIDENRSNWQKAIYPFLNDSNSFRLSDSGKNLFIKKFGISAIPRYFLIDKFQLVSDNFEW